jgi:hypothetical protein
MWPTLILLSVLAGGLCGAFIRGRRAILWGGAVPWLGMLAWLLGNEYLVPYDGGGASMWPVAQLIAGTVMAVAGGVAAAAVRAVKRRGAAA